MDIIPYAKQNILPEDIEAVACVLKSDLLTQGPQVIEFEKAFARYVGSDFAVAVSSGTAALHISALALGLKRGQRVITTPITFAASANCLCYCGAEVVFCDVNPDTGLMDLDRLNDMLPIENAAGIVAVDFAGQPIDMERCREIATRHSLWIIEDACHAPGGYFLDKNEKKQSCGNGMFAELGAFSFHPVKHIACGEGGMVTTNKRELYQKLCQFRTHGIVKNEKTQKEKGDWFYEMLKLGYNYRLSDIHAALGLSQLKMADLRLQRRKEIALHYDEAFKNTSIKPLKNLNGDGHAYHLYVVRVENRHRIYNQLKERGIFAQIHYIPLHHQPYYRRMNTSFFLLEAENYYRNCLSIPMFPTLTILEQECVIKNLKELVMLK